MSFSILISVYEKEKPRHLAACLESLKDEVYRENSEIVLVKDGQLTLELNAVIEKYRLCEDLNLKVYGYEINRGVGYALNYGLEKCRNELVFRMDSDDICAKGRIRKQLEVLSDTTIGLVGGQIEEFEQNIGDLKAIRSVPLSDSQIKFGQFKRNPFNHMTVAFRKTLVKQAGGYLTMHGYEDYYLWIRLLKHTKAVNLKDVLVYARTDESFIGRRMGISLFKREVTFQFTLFRDGYTTVLQFVFAFFFRAIPRLLPKYIVIKLYKSLRKTKW